MGARGPSFIGSAGPPPHERDEGGVATGVLSKKNTCPLLYHEVFRVCLQLPGLIGDLFLISRVDRLNFSIAYGKTANGLARDWKVQILQIHTPLQLITINKLRCKVCFVTCLDYLVHTDQLKIGIVISHVHYIHW